MISHGLTIFIIIAAVIFILILVGFLLFHFYLSEQNKTVGESCMNTDECASPLICLLGICNNPVNTNNPSNPEHGAGGTSSSPGTQPIVGQKCTQQNCANNNCSTLNIYCSSDSLCICGVGQTENQTCSSNSDCNLGLYCDGNNTCKTRTDELPVSNGSDCLNNSQCQVGSYCGFEQTCQSGTDQLTAAFSEKCLQAIRGGPQTYLNIVDNKLVIQCKKQKDFDYENSALLTDNKILTINHDGTVNDINSGSSTTIIGHVTIENGIEYTYFADQYGNSLQANTDNLSCFATNNYIEAWFYDPEHYEQPDMNTIFDTTPQLFEIKDCC